MFDNTQTDSLELLRFYPSLTAIEGFEDALHERVRQVGRLPDHAFPLIVAVERLEGDGALALVSTYTPGKRLSAFFDRPGAAMSRGTRADSSKSICFIHWPCWPVR